MSGPRIGILGATGGIGRQVSCWLHEAGHPLRLAARQPAPLHALAIALSTQSHAFDLYQDDALAAFCQGCFLVVNCAGPSYQVLDRVARSAAQAGAHYIDVSGDGPVWHLLQRAVPPQAGWIAVLSAGMLPGLANLIPAGLSETPGGAMTVYSGGIERVRGAAAADLVLSLNAQPSELQDCGYWYGAAGLYWQEGKRCRLAASGGSNAVSCCDLAHFPGRVTLLPFLSADAERLAQQHQLRTLHWYNVFSGQCLREVLSAVRGRVSNREQLAQAVAEVERASELDMLGRIPYYHLVFDLEPNNKPRQRVVVTTDSSLALTAAVAVSTVNALLRNAIAPGIHFADQVLPPTHILNEVAARHAGTRVCHYLPDACQEVGAL